MGGWPELISDLKADKGWNIILKIIVWLFILAFATFWTIYIINWKSGKQASFWLWEVNKFQPYSDTVEIHTTLLKRDTIRILVTSNIVKPQPKNNNSGTAQLVGNVEAKNLNLGTASQVGDNYNFPSETLTKNQAEDLLNQVNKFRIMNNCCKCVYITSAMGASGRIKLSIKNLLEENGYTVKFGGVTTTTSEGYQLEKNGDFVEIKLGIFN